MALNPRVVKFEHFINDVLREHLKRLEKERNRLCEQAGEYLQLKVAIERLQKDCKEDKSIRTQVLCCESLSIVMFRIDISSSLRIQYGCVWSKKL